MNISKWLSRSVKILNDIGIATARLDCLVLLEDALGKDRSWLLAHPETECKSPTLTLLNEQIERRVGHEPLAYIRGKSEFYGREFLVTADTLEPRSETETMIDLLKSHIPHLLKDGPLYIVDVGTGSGCLGVTAKLEFPASTVYATDISEPCLEVARKNAENLKADVKFYMGNLLEALPAKSLPEPSIILTNLPYVPDAHTINQAAMFEPKVAIFGGPDGLDIYRQLFLQLTAKPQLVFTESLPFQHTGLTQIAKAAGYKLKTSEDFIQVFELG